jgi:hypothetical protein
MKNLYALLSLAVLALHAQAQVGIGTVSPNSMLDLRGSFAPICRSFSATTILTVNDHTLVFTGAAATTATLPDATTCPGRMYDLKNYSVTLPAPVLTINTVSAQTIDGASTWLLNTSNQSVTLVSDGANWDVLGQSVVSASGSAWALGGNSVAATNTLGTTTAYDLPFITNNTEKMRITSAGNVGIGSTAFSANAEALLVYQNSATSFNVIGGKGNLNNYLQLNIQNQNSGSSASSDLVATADNGNETTNYVDLGINSSTYNTSAITGGINNAYLYSAANDFIIGNSTAAKNLIFFTGGTATTNEAMRINGSGNIGVGNSNPAYKLDVNGTIHTGNGSSTNGSLVFANSTNANSVTINTGVTTGSYSLTLPMAQGVANTVLGNNGAGVLSWTTVAAAAGAWSILGNAGTIPGTNFLGTTDNESLEFKANNQLSGKIDLPLNNSLFGYQAGQAATGNNNTFIGYQSGLVNSTGPSNTAVGSIAMVANLGGTGNAALGYGALKANTTGGNNTAVGNSTGVTNTTGTNNTFVGGNADATVVGLSNATAIGYNAKAAVSNSLILGSTGATTPNVGVGVNTFSANPEALLVYQNSSTSFNVIGGKGNLNNYLQLNIQNQNSGSGASSDLVATADNGNETTNYVDLGMNSSTYSAGAITGGADNAYLYSSANDFIIGNSIAGKNLIFFTGGTATTNEAMRINPTGSVGIANTNPQAALDVNGTVKIGTAGTVLNSLIRFTNQSITDNTAFNYNQTRTETFTLAGVNQYATVIVTPRSALPTGLGLAYSYASAANTVLVTLTNASGATIALGTVAFDITVIQ